MHFNSTGMHKCVTLHFNDVWQLLQILQTSATKDLIRNHVNASKKLGAEFLQEKAESALAVDCKNVNKKIVFRGAQFLC